MYAPPQMVPKQINAETNMWKKCLLLDMLRKKLNPKVATAYAALKNNKEFPWKVAIESLRMQQKDGVQRQKVVT